VWIKYFLHECLIYIMCYIKEKHILLIINILLKNWKKLKFAYRLEILNSISVI